MPSTSTARRTGAAGVRIETLPDDDVPAQADWRLAEDAALHGAARVDLDGPVVLDDATTWTRPIRWRSISIRSRARRSRRSSTSRAGCDDELERVNVPASRRPRARKGCTSSFRCRRDTPYEAGMLFCQIVATMVASQASEGRRPSSAWCGRRKDGTIYVDYLQNIQGKTLACAYSARAARLPACRRRSPGRKWTSGRSRRTSRSTRCRPGSLPPATFGRLSGKTKARISSRRLKSCADVKAEGKGQKAEACAILFAACSC